MAVLSFLLFYIGLILRFTVMSNEVDFTAARWDKNVDRHWHRSSRSSIVMAIALEIFWLRSLAFIIILPFLGPHLVAIGKMVSHMIDRRSMKTIDISAAGKRSTVLHVCYCGGDDWLRCRVPFDGLLSTQRRIRALQWVPVVWWTQCLSWRHLSSLLPDARRSVRGIEESGPWVNYYRRDGMIPDAWFVYRNA